jgi:hypothetical protein
VTQSEQSGVLSNKYGDDVVAWVSLSAVFASPQVSGVEMLSCDQRADIAGDRLSHHALFQGANVDYNLGTGKRSNLAVPQHLSPLAGKIDAESREASMTAGTVRVYPTSKLPERQNGTASKVILLASQLTPMPHSRLQLHTGQGDAYDLDGRLLKRNVKAAQVMYAGYNASASYWRAI